MCAGISRLCAPRNSRKNTLTLFMWMPDMISKGVEMDLKDYWPKLKTGGIIAGWHDYITNEESGGRTGLSITMAPLT